MAKHTSGDWKFDCNCVVTADGAKGIAILEQIGSFWEGESQPVMDGDEMEANGRLIASSPDLLNACRLALGGLNALGAKNATVRVIENAISRAEGRV
jgi:hypothetical protein